MIQRKEEKSLGQSSVKCKENTSSSLTIPVSNGIVDQSSELHDLTPIAAYLQPHIILEDHPNCGWTGLAKREGKQNQRYLTRHDKMYLMIRYSLQEKGPRTAYNIRSNCHRGHLLRAKEFNDTLIELYALDVYRPVDTGKGKFAFELTTKGIDIGRNFNDPLFKPFIGVFFPNLFNSQKSDPPFFSKV